MVTESPKGGITVTYGKIQRGTTQFSLDNAFILSTGITVVFSSTESNIFPATSTEVTFPNSCRAL